MHAILMKVYFKQELIKGDNQHNNLIYIFIIEQKYNKKKYTVA